MKSNFVQTFRMSVNRFSSNRTAMRVALIGLFITLGMGEMWAGQYARGTAYVSSGSSGYGKVYVTCSTATPSTPASGDYQTSSYACKSANAASTTYNFYYWALPMSDDYAFAGWSEVDNGIELGDASPYKTKLASPAKPTVNLSDTYNDEKYYATFIKKVNATINLLAPPTGVTYTASCNGASLSVPSSITTKEAFNFTATVSDATKKVLGWYIIKDGTSTKAYFSAENSVSKHYFQYGGSVCLELVDKDKPVFKVDEAYFSDLNAANTAAVSSTSKTIVVVSNGTVPAGTYTISSGVTLLIPYDCSYVVQTTDPGHTRRTTTPTEYKRLTLASGATINVSGTISVGAYKIYAGGGGSMAGGVKGGFGRLHLNAGSTINLNNGAKLYAWGFVTGKGNIQAKSGSEARECFQFDFRGGSHISAVKDNVLPLNQYYVQNIEAPITFYSGSKEILYSAAYANSESASTSVTFIGTGGLFTLSSGSTLTKEYDPSTDRLLLSVEGGASLEGISVSVSGYSMSSSSVTLPITNNMTININSGTTTIKYKTELLPDTRIVIAEGATLSVQNDLYVYDKSDWRADETGYTYTASSKTYKSYFGMGADINPVPYSPTKTFTRTSAALKDAQIVVNGTLSTTSSGKIYTTSKANQGADITSEANGKINFGVAQASSATTFKEGVSTSQTMQDVPVNPAKLHNADDTYESTSGVSAGTIYTYCCGRWLKQNGCPTYTVTWDATTNGGACGTASTDYASCSELGTLPTATKDGYDLVGWFTAASGGTQITTATTVTADVTYYAQFTPKTYTVTYGTHTNGSFTIKVGSGTASSANKTAHYGDVITLAATPNTGYHFDSWSTSPSQTISNNQFTMPASNVTVNATFALNTHKLTWNWNGGSTSSTSYTAANNSLAYGSTITYPANNTMTKTGYTFAGWNSSPSGNPTAMPDADLTITAQWEAITYNIIYNLNGGTQQVSPTPAANYTIESAAITLPTPTKDGFEFAGWYANSDLSTGGVQTTIAAGSTGNKEYWAKWNSLETGFYVDIVDAQDGYLTINMTPLAASGWPYQVNGTAYGRKAGSGDVLCNDDRTIRITHDKSAGQQLEITVKNGAGYATTISRHQYIVPKVYESGGTLSGTDANSIVFVRGGTLTVSGTQAVKALYVAPSAELKVTGTLNVTEKLVLRTAPYQSAILTNNGTINATNKIYYSRQISGASQYHQFGIPLSSCKANAVTLSDGSTPSYGNAWMLKSYNGATRAASGSSDNGANWQILDGDATVNGGVGYEIISLSKYYREFYFPVNLPTSNSVVVTYNSGDAGEKHAGWNIVTSPLTSVYDNTATNPETGLKICELQSDGESYLQYIPDYIYPAVPFSYQATSGQTSISFAGSSIVAAAPQRRVAASEEPERIQWIRLDVTSSNGEGDETSIISHPTRYEAEYKSGIDVAKQSLTASRAIIYSSHAYGDMAFAGVADDLLEQGIALTVYSPSAQELTFSLRENDWLNRMEYVLLVDKETGMQVNLLTSNYTIDVAEGTTRGRFFISGRFKAPQITTDISGAGINGEGLQVEKLIIDNKLYIRVNGVLYDATGKLVNGK